MMVHKWGMIISISLCVLAVSVAGIYLYMRNNPDVFVKTMITLSGNDNKGFVAPTELTTAFDPTQNSPRFVIESDNRETQTLNLRIVWPQSRVGERVASKINCSAGNIKIISQGQGKGEVVAGETLFDRIAATSKDVMIFGGLCSDSSCREIDKKCELYVSGEKQQ